MNENDKYIGKMLDDRYEILDIIGEGGMAIVYRALCHRLNRQVAIKIMRDDLTGDEEFKRRFCAESHAVAMLSHPNIVAVYDVSHNDDIEYIVMELVDGITLKQYMDRRGALAWKETMHFTRQIAKALAHAHERGIIHRDIKPQNIMLLRDGTIKVADFGIAALENEIHENNGQAIGSIHYIAPEQARGESPDARSDVYSLGIVMYEMLTGELPYTGDTLGEVAIKHMNAEAKLPREINADIPAELERITLKAMNAKIEERYQSANELLEDMDAFIQSQTKLETEAAADEYENPSVIPVRSVTELSREKYALRRRRAGRVSYLSGTFAILALIVGLIAFIWNFWLEDVFSPAERIDMQKFIGYNYESVVNSAEINAVYNFNIVYVNDDYSAAGTIIAQEPKPGRSVMLTPKGVDVTITVNSGALSGYVPDVVNKDYREAMSMIQQAGFAVELENSTSSSVTKDYVISTSPMAGEQISSGSTVYVVVSTGPEIVYTKMPNLIGISEDSAIKKIESYNLSYGGTNRVASDYEAGTVIDQSVAAFTDIEEHTKIIITVSSGPES